MKHIDKIGFTLALIGLGGLPETYERPDKMALALGLIIIGSVLIFIGDSYRDVKKRNNRSNQHNIDRDGSRPYFLR